MDWLRNMDDSGGLTISGQVFTLFNFRVREVILRALWQGGLQKGVE